MKIAAIGTPGITSNEPRFTTRPETTIEPAAPGRRAQSAADVTMTASEAIERLREAIHEILNKVRRGAPAAAPDQPPHRFASTPSATPRAR